jgi:hypothetical protein
VVQFATGLATVGVRIRDNAGADSLVRTTTGVVEDIAGSGIYRKSNLVAPTSAGQYTIVWDNGAGSPVYDIQELIVTYSAAAGLTGPVYVTSAEIRSAMATTGETFDQAEIDLAISSASRGMDSACGRRFYLDPDNTSVRYYSPRNIRRIFVDDIVDVVSVNIDRTSSGVFGESWTLGSQYILEPLNADTDSKPFESIRVTANSGWAFPLYERSVEVTGQFGWAAVPDRIKAATLILAQKELMRIRQAPFGFVALPGEQSATVARIAANDPQIAPIVAEFQRGTPFL